MQHIEAFPVLEFKVNVAARDQHVDDVVVVSCNCVMQRRVTLHILHIDHLTISAVSDLTAVFQLNPRGFTSFPSVSSPTYSGRERDACFLVL